MREMSGYSDNLRMRYRGRRDTLRKGCLSRTLKDASELPGASSEGKSGDH